MSTLLLLLLQLLLLCSAAATAVVYTVARIVTCCYYCYAAPLQRSYALAMTNTGDEIPCDLTSPASGIAQPPALEPALVGFWTGKAFGPNNYI